jgi:hypothetical protein
MCPADDAPEAGSDVGEGGTPVDADGPASDGSPAADEQAVAGATDEQAVAGATSDGRGRREVEVPQSLYKVVTVFSTLLAVVLVVVGFSVMDMATTVLSNPPGSLVVQLLAVVVPMETLAANRSVLALSVGLAGLALVAAGAGTYVYGSRFRAPGMGKPKDEADEASGDG